MIQKSKYFRISVTSHCNLSCFFCHREGNFTNRKDELSPRDFQTACRVALECGFQKFKLTGGEPTLRNDICEIVSKLSELNLPDFSMITNGTTLNQKAKSLWNAGLRRINVTLNTLNQNKFKQINNTDIPISNILKGIEAARNVGFRNIKLNFVYFDESSKQDFEDLISYIKGNDMTLVLLPVISNDIYYGLNDLYELLRVYEIDSEELVTDREGIQKRLIYLKSGAKILLRLDELAENRPYVFCQKCSNSKICREGIFPIRLSAQGELIACMASLEHRISIKNFLKSDDIDSIKDAFSKIDRWYSNG